MTEKYIYIQRILEVEERFKKDYSEGSLIDGKYEPKVLSTGWWLVFDDNTAVKVGEKPEDIKAGDRMKFTMEKVR